MSAQSLLGGDILTVLQTAQDGIVLPLDILPTDSILLTVLTSMPFCSAMVAKVCPYGSAI